MRGKPSASTSAGSWSNGATIRKRGPRSTLGGAISSRRRDSWHCSVRAGVQFSDETQQIGLAFAAKPLRGDDRPDVIEALRHVLIDQDIVIFGPVTDFGSRPLHPAGDDLIAIGSTLMQAALQLFHRRWQDENANQVGTKGIIELLRTLPIDVEQRIAPELQRFLDGLFWAAVEVVEDISPFGEFVRFDKPVELGRVDEMIIHALDLSRPHWPRGGADRHGD